MRLVQVFKCSRHRWSGWSRGERRIVAALMARDAEHDGLRRQRRTASSASRSRRPSRRSLAHAPHQRFWREAASSGSTTHGGDLSTAEGLPEQLGYAEVGGTTGDELRMPMWKDF